MIRYICCFIFFFSILLSDVRANPFLELTLPDAPSDSAEKLIINEIVIAGNKITRRNIIEREIMLPVNQPLDKVKLEEQILLSKNNLMNTGLFNVVKIEYVKDEFNYIKLLVLVTERWYIWPFPILQIADRNFNTWWLTKDLSRLNYGLFLVYANFRGRKETIVLRGQMGFTKQLGLAYNVPYIDKKQRNGLSFSMNYAENNQVIIRTVNNKTEFLRNYSNNIRNEIYGSLTFTHRQSFFDTHSLSAKYNSIFVTDTVLKINPYYLSRLSKNQVQYLTLDYIYRFDKRDYKPYPLKGHYFELEAVKYGLGILHNESDVDVFFVTGNVRKYWKLSERWHYAGSLKFKASSTSFQPFYFVRGLGYNDFVRGFEYYNFDGQNFTLAKNNIKYTLVKPKTIKVFEGSENPFSSIYYAFYLNLFADIGKVYDRQTINDNIKSSQYLSSVGLGLDWLGSYDRVFRFETAYNSFGQLGFYIHFSSPI